MTSEKLTADSASSDAVPGSSESKVLKFDETSPVTPAKDINTKISALDTDLAHLRAELGAINSSVEEGLDRLGDTDTDLTAKVSETYKRLGEIDNAYKSLIEISSRIDSDIQKLNGDVSTVAEQSASGIKTLKQTTIAQSNEFAQKNQQVVSKVNHLLETSKLTGDLLSQKIESTTEKMLQMEKQVVAEIENLSSATRDKTDNIEASVESNRAKILKLQAVDEAIIKRATTLEISSAELAVKSQDMQVSVEQLQQTTGNLSNGLAELREQTRALEDISRNHGSLIGSLQKASADITDKVALLANRENKHFNFSVIGFLALLVISAVIYFTQQSRFDFSETKLVEQSAVLDEKIQGLQQIQKDSVATVSDSLLVLEDRLEQVTTKLQEKIEKESVQTEQKLQTVNDQLKSVDARLSQSSPFSKFGDDNIIHGQQWITSLPEENFVLQLAYVDNTDTLYQIAQRYNYYLKDALSYFEVSDNGSTKYVLLSGNYTTPQQAAAKMQSMPHYIAMQRPVMKRLADVQAYIVQNKK